MKKVEIEIPDGMRVESVSDKRTVTVGSNNITYVRVYLEPDTVTLPALPPGKHYEAYEAVEDKKWTYFYHPLQKSLYRTDFTTEVFWRDKRWNNGTPLWTRERFENHGWAEITEAEAMKITGGVK